MIITINTSSRASRLGFNISLLIFGIILCSTAAYSWTGPSGSAPNNNVSAPINVGTTSQIKDGALSVNGFSNVGSSYIAGRLGVGVASPAEKLHVSGAAYITGDLGVGIANPAQKLHIDGRVRATGFCIGTSCVTSWPSGGSYGASTWGRVAANREYTCPNGRVITGIEFEMQNNAPDPAYLTGVRIRCTVLTP